MVTGYGLDGRDSIPGSARFFSSAQRPDRLWGSPSLLSSGYRGLFHGEVERPLGREAAEVKISGAIPPLLYSSSWRGAGLIKQRDSFTVYLLNSKILLF
jgi:hypothetical protein